MEADLREPQSYHRSAQTSKLEEADPFTQIDSLPHTHTDLVDADTNREQSGGYRQVAQGHLHTICKSDLNLKPTQEDPEPTQQVVGFRPYQTQPN